MFSEGDACCCCVLLGFGVYFGLFFFVLYNVIFGRRPRPGDPPRCPSCDYIIKGLPSNVCPECGKPFDPAMRTEEDDPQYEWPSGYEPDEDDQRSSR